MLLINYPALRGEGRWILTSLDRSKLAVSVFLYQFSWLILIITYTIVLPRNGTVSAVDLMSVPPC